MRRVQERGEGEREKEREVVQLLYHIYILLFFFLTVCIPVHHMDMHVAASVNPYSRQRSSSINKSGGFPSLTFSSLPQQPSPVPDYITVQRSYSFGGRSSSTKRSDSSFRSQNRATSGLNHVAKRHRPNSIHPKKLHHLTHSYSAPSIGFVGKRRHSLQHLDTCGTEEPWEADTEVDGVNSMGRPQLRRTSSEVYVDRGKARVVSPLVMGRMDQTFLNFQGQHYFS